MNVKIRYVIGRCRCPYVHMDPARNQGRAMSSSRWSEFRQPKHNVYLVINKGDNDVIVQCCHRHIVGMNCAM